MIKYSEIKFTVKVEEEDIDPRNMNYIDNDPEVIQAILDNMAASEYGWAYVVVIAEWNGFRGEYSVGGISYASKQEFEENELDNMKSEAVGELLENVNKSFMILANHYPLELVK